MISSLLFILCVGSAVGARSFIIDYERDCFLKDGQCYRYIAGEMHYFRVPQEYWGDRLTKMRAAGFTTVQTYIAWNVHAPFGEYNPAMDPIDLIRFIQLAAAADLTVIVRPGPYLDAEWDFGGFPAWLLQSRPTMGMSLRSNATVFMEEVAQWYDILLPALVPYLYKNGGPIIAVQVENEAGGSPPCDAAHFDYLVRLRDMYRHHLGPDVVYLTVDGDNARLAKCGNVEGLYSTLNFGAEGAAAKKFAVQKRVEPNGPYVCSAFFSGWLDHWGFEFNRVSTDVLVSGLQDVLEFANRSASVSMYMFHGGSNFAWGQGARGDFDKAMGNNYTRLWGKMTSYDYDAPLSEAGDSTDKYMAIRDLLSKYNTVRPVPANTTKYYGGRVELDFKLDILALADGIEAYDQFHVKSRYPLPMEEMGQYHGPVIYQVSIPASVPLPAEVDVPLYGDRLYLITVSKSKEVRVQIHSRNRKARLFTVNERELTFLVDENGHSNSNNVRYGNDMYQKGITSNVTANGVVLENWDVGLLGNFLIPGGPDDTGLRERVMWLGENAVIRQSVKYSGDYLPAWYCADISRYQGYGDTFVNTQEWGKGIMWLTSPDHQLAAFNLGRYWPLAGPQQRLYCPAPWRQQSKTLNLFEFERTLSPVVTLEDTPYVDGPYDNTQI